VIEVRGLMRPDKGTAIINEKPTGIGIRQRPGRRGSRPWLS
jgi:hypothetical protein